MQIRNSRLSSLGSENFHDLGFKSEEDLNIEISKLIQVRSELANNSEVYSIK
tara:strand:+ start:1134 stop:1289 length:156 start_codon:yes stop_codon:yes gene_type:complete